MFPLQGVMKLPFAVRVMRMSSQYEAVTAELVHIFRYQRAR